MFLMKTAPSFSKVFGLLLFVLLLVTWCDVTSAMSLPMQDALPPLFPPSSSTPASPSQGSTCREEDVRQMCQSCSASQPQCTVDLVKCSWTCSSSTMDPALAANSLADQQILGGLLDGTNW
ncbi:hypothetical protein BaRGS_00026514 [Batillaria attramentaria]|uniref:Uncharacterized protein n=1 Tax=Batillaria attramentaria TaxID=370345 RepID=A0ABD0K4L5_9CAEN